MIETNLYDQASGLRRLGKMSATKVITVTGGKGGIGKTNLTLGIATAMAKQGKKVMVLDADLGLANVDVLLGLKVERNLYDFIQGNCELNEILVQGPHGMKIIPAASGLKYMTELSAVEHGALIHSFSELNDDIDVLLVDTAAGISKMVLNFSKAAQDILVVVCDEPTSITDAYALIKILNKEHGVSRFKIVANMVQNYHQGRDLFIKLARVTERFLSANLELVACIPLDEKLKLSVRKQKMLVDAFPNSPAALAITALANKALTWPVPMNARGHMSFFVEHLLFHSRNIGDLPCD